MTKPLKVREMKLCFVGDVVPNRAYHWDQSLKDYILSHHIRVCNLEGAFSVEQKPLFKAGKHLLLDSSFLSPFSACFNVAVLANNHAMDFETEGLKTTQSLCLENGMRTVGAGQNLFEAYTPLDFEKCRIIALAENEFGAAGKGAPGIAVVDDVNRILKLIQEGRRAGKIVIIVAHGGTELIPIPPPYLRERYRLWIECGAELVVGSHPHVVQGHEIYKGKHIFYSLGNFAFQSEHFSTYENTKWSILVSADIVSGEINIVPVQPNQNGYLTFGDGDTKTRAYLELCEMLNSPVYEAEYDRIAQNLYSEWYHRLHAKSPHDAAILLHYLRCDAHRNILQHALSRLLEQEFDPRQHAVPNGEGVDTPSHRLPKNNGQIVIRRNHLGQDSTSTFDRAEWHKQIQDLPSLNIVVGAGDTEFDSWISTDYQMLDITRSDHWERLFSPNSIDRILAEHVIEHIEASNLPAVLRNARNYLKPGGHFRVAVPDANHPSSYVRDLTKPGGLEPGADDHRVFLDINAMITLSVVAGFRLLPIEWFDSEGHFHHRDWQDSDGIVSRSSRYYKGRFNNPSEYKKLLESTTDNLQWQYETYNISYTSLIVDFVKDDQYDISPDSKALTNLLENYKHNAVHFRSKYCAQQNKSLFIEIAASLGLMFNDNMTSERHFLNRFIPYIDNPIVIDVGAHEGKYSSCVRDLNDSAVIHAMEPNPTTFQKLKIKADSFGIIAINAGCSDKEGEAALFDYPSEEGSGHASIHKAFFDEFHHRQVVPVKTHMTTIDSYINKNRIDKVALLKIDTEGHEYSVLKGATKSIEEGIIDCIQFEFNAIHVQSKTYFLDIVKLLPNFLFYRMLSDGLIPMGNYHSLTWELFQLQNIVALYENHPMRKILEI
jgi:FkbM family methyltransferase